MATCHTIYINNTNTVILSGLVDSLTNSPVTDATVQLILKDKDGTEVTGQTWPLVLGPIPNTLGGYRGTLDHTLVLTENTYTAEITAIAPDGSQAYWLEEVQAKYRNSCETE